MLNEKENFFNNDDIFNSESSLFINQHKIWKANEKNSIKQYYLLFNGIDQYLPFVGKAMALYTLYCLYSKNETGESFHGVDSLKKDLMVSDRTINTWNRHLEDLGLIKRIDGYSKSTHTFILPTRDYIDKKIPSSWNDNDILEFVNKLLSNYQVLGFTECQFYHAFEWTNANKNAKKNVPHNVLIIAFSKHLKDVFDFKDNDAKKKFFERNLKTRHAFVYIEIPKNSKFNITIKDKVGDFDHDNKKELKIFDTPLENIFSNLNVTDMDIKGIHGVAFNPVVNLKKFNSDEYGKEDIDYLSSFNDYFFDHEDDLATTSIMKEGDKTSSIRKEEI